MGDEAALEELQARIGVRFEDISLLRRALTHRSFANEHPELEGADNERLEFLGDAVLDFLAGSYLFTHYPEMREGELTNLRAAIVRTETLAEFAQELGLGPFLLLGRGEEASGGRTRPAILCATFEALVGAIYVDQGLEPARALFERLAAPKVEAILREAGVRDPKTELQELTQMAWQLTPEYRTVGEQGPDHAKRFTVEVWIGGRPFGRGTGPSKQKAAMEAAREALRHPELLRLAASAQSFVEEEPHSRP
ncbi:MAG: ribonuclease III [Anaerolineae bacterium]